MDRFPAYTDLFSRLEVLQLLQINLAHVDTRRAEYLSIAHLADASNEACNAWPGWVRGRLAICQLQVWSQICVLPWTTALHWARPTPLHRFAPICDGYGLRSGDEAVQIFFQSSSEMQRMITYVCWRQRPEAATSLPAETNDGDADKSASPSAKRAEMDSQSVSLKLLVTVAVTRFQWSVNNRLSQDNDQLRKKRFQMPSCTLPFKRT